MDKIIHGDSAEELKKLPDNSVDLVCTDPPYGYSFMGKNWDKAVPSVEIWKECLRVLKPGGFAFVMSAPRQDVLSQMIVRIGEAGFDTDFTSIYWTYASGFPKAMNIGKMVDKRNGTTRKILGVKHKTPPATNNYGNYGNNFKVETTQGTSPLEGSYGGFQPKPAVEVIIVAMKPLSEKTFVDQALKNGKGVTWLDDCRVPTTNVEKSELHAKASKNPTGVEGYFVPGIASEPHIKGRFPANLLVSDDVLGEHSRYFNLDTFPFAIVPKASRGEKNEGLDDLPKGPAPASARTKPAEGRQNALGEPRANHHPTVKPLKLMSYLITLGSRPGDVVLEPFMGSGTTCLAAKNLNRHYIGIEREREYVKIAEARLKEAPNLFQENSPK